MASDYIPSTDAGVLSFASNFSTIVTAAPLPLGLTTSQATSLAGFVTSYSTSLTAATDPSTRGPAAVLAKDTAKRTLVAYLRTLARIVHAKSNGDFLTRQNLVRLACQRHQQRRLSAGQPNGSVWTGQFSPTDIEAQHAKLHWSARRFLGRR